MSETYTDLLEQAKGRLWLRRWNEGWAARKGRHRRTRRWS